MNKTKSMSSRFARLRRRYPDGSDHARALLNLGAVLLVAVLAAAGCSQVSKTNAGAPSGQNSYRVQTDHGCPPAKEISRIVGATVELTTQDDDPVVCTYEQPASDVFGVVRFAFSSGMTLEQYIASSRKLVPKATFTSVTIGGVQGVKVGPGVALPLGGGVMEVYASGFHSASRSDAQLTRTLAGRYAKKIIQDMKR